MNTLSASQMNSAVIGYDGGKIKVLNTAAAIRIPRGAIPEGELAEITITVYWDRTYYPPLQENDFVIGPTIHCEPDGFKFKKPVTITIPHSAVQINEKLLQIWTKESNGKYIPASQIQVKMNLTFL